MRAGENVCIQAITPTQASAAFASRQAATIASADFRTGRTTIRTGIVDAASNASTTRSALAATWRSASSP